MAQVRDGYDPQTNIVRQDGVRSVLMVLLKNGSASTLSVVAGAKQAMANVLKTVNSAVRVKEFSDQSVFVRAAISGVVREGVIAGALTALMILLFSVRGEAPSSSRSRFPFRFLPRSRC